jgi:ABC-type transporter Mla MlaB component
MMQEAPTSGTLDLNGPRTIRNADQTRSLLLEALCTHSAVGLDCSAVTEADLSLVQLLISGRISAELFGKTLTLIHPPDGAFLQTLSKAGFTASPDPLTGLESFWIKKEAEDVQNHSCRG